MTSPDVIIVQLRQPSRNDPNERRTDPFYEFGSFGCTGCHRTNLMNSAKIGELNGVRLAFAQGGPDGVKLILLTPPIKTKRHRHTCEVNWPPTSYFRYERAPLLINNDGRSDFEELLSEFMENNRSTPVGCFTSAFRSRKRPLPASIGRTVIESYENLVASASPAKFAETYVDTLPHVPPFIDTDRRSTYSRCRSGMQIGGKKKRSRTCSSRRKRAPRPKRGR